MSTILITGADGFIGSAIALLLSQQCRNVRKATRSGCYGDSFKVGNIGPDTDWSEVLQEVNVVIHTAGRAHVVHDSKADGVEELKRVNVEGTLNLADQAARTGVKRFIFISTIKVNGEQTNLNQPFLADDKPVPNETYGVLKYEAEKGLLDLASRNSMEVVIIRPPLVYGPGVKANFLTMMQWLYKGIPLPLGAINNRRSLVFLDNLVDLIVLCIDHPDAANQTFLVADGEDLSTTELLRRIAAELRSKTWLLPVPMSILHAAAILLGKKAVARRLFVNLQVDISKTTKILGWSPPFGICEALHKTVQAYLHEQKSKKEHS